MPSSHAQFVAYFAVYVALFLVWRHSPSVRVVEDEGEGSGVVETQAGVRKGQREEGEGGSRTRRRRKASVVINGVERPLAAPMGIPDAITMNGSMGSEDGASPVYSLQLHHPRLTHTLLTLAVIALAIVVAGSRVYLHYHTTKQVLAGGAAGTGFAVFWFGVTEWLRRAGWVEWALEWGIVRSARVRDLVCEEDLVELGWQVWEDKKRRRRAARHLKGGRAHKTN